jgi:RimJ/RimL family protein N-acetyltransferase
VEPRPPALTGRVVRLRAPEPADADALNDLFNDHDVRSALGATLPQPVEGFHAWISAARAAPDHVNLTIERLEPREPIGMCDLMKIEAPTRTAMLGIWIGRPWWGRGLGTDAVRTLCRFGFEHVNLHRITLEVNAENEPAIRAYRAVGFREEGRLREAAFVHGARMDTLVMGILAGELIADDAPA